jgi:hypothetical protein
MYYPNLKYARLNQETAKQDFLEHLADAKNARDEEAKMHYSNLKYAPLNEEDVNQDLLKHLVYAPLNEEDVNQDLLKHLVYAPLNEEDVNQDLLKHLVYAKTARDEEEAQLHFKYSKRNSYIAGMEGVDLCTKTKLIILNDERLKLRLTMIENEFLLTAIEDEFLHSIVFERTKKTHEVRV